MIIHDTTPQLGGCTCGVCRSLALALAPKPHAHTTYVAYQRNKVPAPVRTHGSLIDFFKQSWVWFGHQLIIIHDTVPQLHAQAHPDLAGCRTCARSLARAPKPHEKHAHYVDSSITCFASANEPEGSTATGRAELVGS